MTTYQVDPDDAERKAAPVAHPDDRTDELQPDSTDEVRSERDEAGELQPEREEADELLPERDEADELRTERDEDAEPAPTEELELEPDDEPQTEPVGELSDEHDETAEVTASDVTASDVTASDISSETAGRQPLVAADDYGSRWDRIQIGFVDQPRDAVQNAGTLVGELILDVTRALEAELAAVASRTGLDDTPSTEDLRVAFQRYRELFDRLVAA